MTKKQPTKTTTKSKIDKAPKTPSKRLFSDEDLVVEEKSNPFTMKEYPDFKKELEFSDAEKERIKKLEDFFSFDKKENIDIPKLNLDAKAYPNNDDYINIPGAHDTQKWLSAVQSIYTAERNGQAREYCLSKITSGWNPTEKYDFLNWLKFYEEGSHLKYKVAQHRLYENDLPGYILPYRKDSVKEEVHVNGRDVDSARDHALSEMPVAEKKRIIEKQRNKIIGRLDSTEKLLRSEEGQLLAGKEFETLIEVIYALKKKMQMVNKVSTSTRLYEDMIVREANVLNKNGFIKAANVLYSFAEDTKKENDSIPAAAPPAPPTTPSGAPGGLPAVIPTVPEVPSEGVNNAPTSKPQGLSNFLNNLDTGKLTTKKDQSLVEDELFIEDHEGDLIVEAQEASVPDAPVEAPITADVPSPEVEATPPANVTKPLEVEDNEGNIDKKDTTESLKAKNFDNMIDTAFSNLKIDDIVAKLEDLAKIFKTREVPRQLSIVDMMLDSLGLASFFPSLSEATNKALESNNYISTRVEDILSKLRGSMKTNDIDLRNNNENTQSPEIEGVKSNLKDQETKEKNKKEMRKNLADKALEDQSKETPDVEINEDLETPPANEPVPSPKPPVV